MQLKKYQKVEIEWIDSSGSSGWRRDKEYLGDEKFIDCKTVGYFIGKTKRTIQVIQSLNVHKNQDDSRNVDSMIQIPKVAINKIKLLK